jgi:SAM-dependent methyltransferase
MGKCRICDSDNTRGVVDLGEMPLANKLKTAADAPEKRFPLAVKFCRDCGNLQLTHCVEASELYDDYLYITPSSATLEAHNLNLFYHMRAQGYLPDNAFLLEFGSNIGHFLKYAQSQVGRVLGIDPARAIVEMANARGVPTICDYFSPATAKAVAAEHGRASLVAGRHCAAHNPDPHALVTGARAALAGNGVFLMENAYGLNTILNGEIGQIYHEHMYYYTAWSVRELFARNGLDLIDLLYADAVHGGSMVFFGAPKGSRPIRPIVAATIAREQAILNDALLDLLPATLERWRTETRALLDRFRDSDRSVWMYGGSAKAATFINAVGITEDDIAYCADSTEEKIGRYLPGTGIQIRTEAEAIAARPDYYLVTAWNYRNELIQKVRAGGNLHSGFAVPFPEVQVIVTSAADVYSPPRKPKSSSIAAAE